MRRSIRVLVVVVVNGLALAACSDQGDVETLRKDVTDLRTDLQRAQKDNEKLALRLSAMERRIGGVGEDIAQVRQLAADVRPAAVANAGVGSAAPSGPVDPATGVALSTTAAASPDAVAIRTFLGTPDGRKVLAAAIQADREAQDVERAKRTVDGRVDRFAKAAGLTADQTKRMKDILERQAEATRGVWANVRDLGPDATAEERDALRKQDLAQAETMRKQTDDQLRIVLTQTQYDQYQESAKQRVPGVPGGGNNARRNRNNGGAQSGN